MTLSHHLTVQLPHFEGPLGLLLYLIRKDEMDIMDIKIHEITAQYLDYIKMMKELDIEVAGEFIAMAATLIQIKSRMLLPQYDENGEIVEAEDPRKELVQKLMEYQKYQEAAKLLADRPWVGRDVFLRGTRERLDVKDDSVELEDNALFSLISAYRRSMKAAKKRIHRVAAKAQSIASRILQMKDRLIVGARVTMVDLVEQVRAAAGAAEDRARDTLITFLSLLELGKLGFVGLNQTEPYADIWIDTKKPIEADAISRVEEYDNLNSEDVANTLLAKTEEPEANPEEFVLKDAEDFEAPTVALNEGDDFTAGLVEEINPEEMATDADIVAAEQDLNSPKDEDHGPTL